MNKIFTLIAALCLTVAAQAQTVVDIIVNSPNHNTLETAVLAAGLQGTLSEAGPYTVFAPTDEAFNALPPAVLEAALNDPNGLLTEVLLYHVVSASALSSSLSDGQVISTLLGQDVTVSIVQGQVFINNAQVTVADIPATNGVVHVINAVLLPELTQTPTIAQIVADSPNHNTLESVLNLAGLTETLSTGGPYTLFAPTDAAFAALPQAILDAVLADPNGLLTEVLLYHVVNGAALSTSLSDGQSIETLLGQNITVTINQQGVFINGAEVLVADLEASNGVVHVIDAVLVPEAPQTNTVADIVINSADHNTLQTALEVSQLIDVLASEGPFTLFAPTDAAFNALPAGLLEQLLADPEGQLTQILLYHVTDGTALANSLSDGQMIMTLNGQSITVTINADGVFINNAEVIVADVQATNGVVHVIDAVLVPATPPATVVDIIVNSADHTTLETAVIAAGLVETLSGAGPFTVFAPTDAAFAAVPTAILNALLADPNGLLTQVLTYHVAPALAPSSSLSNNEQVATVNGQNVLITVNNGDVFVNNAQVIVADLIAQNGIVHVIDAVLVPQGVISVAENTAVIGNVYPNPAVDEVRVDLRNSGLAQVRVLDAVGKVVLTESFNNVSNTLNVAQLPSGVYHMQVTQNGATQTFRWMKI